MAKCYLKNTRRLCNLSRFGRCHAVLVILTSVCVALTYIHVSRTHARLTDYIQRCKNGRLGPVAVVFYEHVYTSKIIKLFTPYESCLNIAYVSHIKPANLTMNLWEINNGNITYHKGRSNQAIYREIRLLYMQGINYFVLAKAKHGFEQQVLDWTHQAGTGLSGLQPTNIGIALSDNSVLFHHTHIDIFGSVYPWELTENDSMTWLNGIYPENQTFRTDKTENSNITNTTVPFEVNSRMKDDRRLLDRYELRLRKMSKLTEVNVISMSLYGSSGRYTQGAIRNAQLTAIYFPTWKLRFYLPHPDSKRNVVPNNVISTLQRLGAEVVYVTPKTMKTIPPMMWRFLVADDRTVDVFIIQDSDSRLNLRLSTVVDDWLKTNKTVHCIRDHPSHSWYALSGGLWGARRNRFITLINDSLSHIMTGQKEGYLIDMNFLNKHIWPVVVNETFCHDSFSCQKWPSSHRFPIARVGFEHLGQVFDEYGIGRKGDMAKLARSAPNKKCILKE